MLSWIYLQIYQLKYIVVEILVIDCYDVDWLESYSLTLFLSDLFGLDFLVLALLAVQGHILLAMLPDETAPHFPPESWEQLALVGKDVYLQSLLDFPNAKGMISASVSGSGSSVGVLTFVCKQIHASVWNSGSSKIWPGLRRKLCVSIVLSKTSAKSKFDYIIRIDVNKRNIYKFTARICQWG